MAIWKSYRISDVINEIEGEKFVLPVIQRRLVWDVDKMELLFDTLLKGDSFGGIMVIQEEKGSEPLFNFRPFTKDGSDIISREVDKLTQDQFFVIDGQQRLQTFYIGLNGSINGKVMYFDLFSSYRNRFEFKFENKESALPEKSKDDDARDLKEHKWYLAKNLLRRLKETNDEDQVADEIIKRQKITVDVQMTHIKKNVKAFYKNIMTSESLGISKVLINKTLDEIENKQRIVELFRRLNDGGTKLSSFDLVASILKGFAWEMEVFLEQTLNDYEEIGLSQDNLIKLIFLLQDNHRKEMASIEAKDADFAIQNKDRIKATLKSLKCFLLHSELYNYYKDGNRSFIPLFFIAYHIFHKKIENSQREKYFDNFDAGNEDFPKMKNWVFHSLLNGVFRSRGAGWIPYKTGVRKILETLRNNKNQLFPTNEIFKVYINHPVTFSLDYTEQRINKLDRVFLFYIVYGKNLIIRNQDIDHIMPKSILSIKGYDWDLINSIYNYQLLDSGTNRGLKNGKTFKYWVNRHVTDIDAYLERHLIPQNNEIWDEDRFLDFIRERGKLLKLRIEENIRTEQYKG